MPADVTGYRLRDASTGEVVASGQAALDAPFEIGDNGRPRRHLHWQAPTEEPRRISDGARYRGRRRRLRKRLEKKRPLFADTEYAQELATRPEYYGQKAREPR